MLAPPSRPEALRSRGTSALKTVACLAVLALAAFGLSPSPAVAQGERMTVTIGTGGVTAVYYPTGRAICRLVNKDRAKHGVHCLVKSTGGSVDNLNRLRAGEIDLGTVQSDWQHHAYHGTSKFEDVGPDKALRSVFALHPEPFTVVARADAGIARFQDLKGKRVNIGNPGSGQRLTMELVMEAFGWTLKDFALALELDSASQAKALCENKVDAIVMTVGHPSSSIKEATTSCGGVIVDISGPVIDGLIESHVYYRRAAIPEGMYPGMTKDARTFGVGATLVASARVPENAIYAITRSVFENFGTFKKTHPALAHLDKRGMFRESLSAPLHPGALRYAREAGLR